MDNSWVSSTWVITCISPCSINIVGMLITLIGIELGIPSQWCFNHHDSKIKIYFVVIGKNWLFAKLQPYNFPPAIYACSDSIILFLLYCVILPAYSMCWPIFGLQRIMLQTFQTMSKDAIRSLSCTQLCWWSWWTHLSSKSSAVNLFRWT